MLIYILLLISNLNADWSQEGEYSKIKHGFTKIDNFRYSIDTTLFLIYDDNKLVYFDKYSGNISQTYSKIFQKSFKDASPKEFKIDYNSCALGVDENIWTYSLVTDGYDSFDRAGKLLIQKDLDSIFKIEKVYEFNKIYYVEYSYNVIQFYDFDNSSFYYFDYDRTKKEGGIYSYDSDLEFQFNYKYPSAKRIEDIADGFKFNEYNYDVIVPMGDRIYREGIYKYSILKPFTSYSFANNETDILVQKYYNKSEERNIYRNYIFDSKNNDSSYIYSETQFGNIYYLEDNKFITQLNKRTFAIIDGVDFQEYHRFETPFDVSKSFYDSTNNEIYYLSKEFVYKKKINLNLNTIISNFICKSKADVDELISFYNVSTGIYDEVKWDFDDGNISNEINPLHKFDKTGDYFVKLHLYKDNKEVDFYERKISIYKKLEAKFEYEIVSTDKPFRINFENKTEGTINNFKWFKDDTLFSEEINPQLDVDKYGTLKIKLEVQDSNSIEIYEETLSLFPKALNDNFDFRLATAQSFVDLQYFGKDTFFFNYDIYNKIEGVHFGYINNEILDTNSYFRTKNGIETPEQKKENLNVQDKIIELFYSEFAFQKLNEKLYLYNFSKFWELVYFGVQPFYDGDRFFSEINVCSVENKNISLLYKRTEEKRPHFDFYYFNKLNSFNYLLQEEIYTFDSEKNKIDTIFKNLPFSRNTFIKVPSNTDFIYLESNFKLFKLNPHTLEHTIINLNLPTQYNTKEIIDDYLLINTTVNSKYAILKYDLVENKLVDTIFHKLFTVNKICKYNDGIILFGNKDYKLAYEIFEKGGSYLKEYDVKANFMNATLNEKNEYLSHIRLIGVKSEDYLFFSKIENFMSVNKDSDIVFGNSIPLKRNAMQIEVFSILGQSLENSSNSLNHNYSISHLPNGVYFYKITYNNKVEFGKILKN